MSTSAGAQVADYDYDLPPALIAQRPVEPRDAGRLLVLDRAGGGVAHHHFRDLGDFLLPGDILLSLIHI